MPNAATNGKDNAKIGTNSKVFNEKYLNKPKLCGKSEA